MSNFTRSILYSTSVLVAGLVAIFAIYSNVAITPNGSNVAQISPAAGGSDLGISIDTPLDNVSSDTQSLIGPASHDADDAMQKAVDQIDSTINEFETIKSSTDENKGSYYDAGQSFKLAADLSQIEQEVDDQIDNSNLTEKMRDMIDQSVEQGKAVGAGNTSEYVGERIIAYGCWMGGEDTWWGTCYRYSTFEEDMDYNKTLSGGTTTINNNINSAASSALADIGEVVLSTVPSSDITAAIDAATSDALSKAPASVRGEAAQAILEERIKRGY